MAQLIPVFLIAFFVIDNSWLEKKVAKYRREASESLEEAKALINEREQNEAYFERITKDAEGVIAKANRKKFYLSMRRRESVKENLAKLAEAQAKLAGYSERYRQTVERTGASRDRVIARIKEMEDAAEASAKYYSIMIIAMIISGMLGETLALWGLVGLYGNISVIAVLVAGSITIAGMLSVLAIDRLMIDASLARLRLIRSIWIVIIFSLTAATYYWIIISVQIKNLIGPLWRNVTGRANDASTGQHESAEGRRVSDGLAASAVAAG
jgi:ABC-type multidrug transport system fused ATPase/permease subunit